MKKILVTIAAMVLAVAAFIAIGCLCYPQEAEPTTWEEYTVLPGEDLWHIAKEQCCQGNDQIRNAHDIRTIIADIKEANDLPDYNVQAGQIISIPIYDK